MRRLSALLAVLLVSAAIVVTLPNASSAVDPATTTTAPPGTTTFSGNVTWTDRTVPEDETYQLDPYASTTVTVIGNLTVRGTLRMHPYDATIVHKIIFTTANEEAFNGTPNPDNAPYSAAMPSDKGLWVLGKGKLDAVGTTREPWVRATGGILADATSFTVDHSIQGWRTGDVLLVAPTALDDYAFEQVMIQSVSGTTVTLDQTVTAPTTPHLVRAHPATAISGQANATAEIINVTRNAQIFGSPPELAYPRAGTQNNAGHGRAHILINNTEPAVQKLDYALIRYMGPRQYDISEGGSRYVLGRYGIHFHKSYGFNVGTTITGTVVRDSGSHAFVAHRTHAITFSKTIAFNDSETPYWWDTQANEEAFLSNDESHNVSYNSTVAAQIHTDPITQSLRLAGYSASCGPNNVIANSVAIGVQQFGQGSAVLWPEGGNQCENTWNVNHDVAHNNQANGFFSWQNDTADAHDLTNTFVAYHNGDACIEHGAYRNAFQYSTVKCVANRGQAAVISEAQGPGVADPAEPQQMNDFIVRGGSVVPYALRIGFHSVSGGKWVELHRWNISGYTDNAVVVEEAGEGGGSRGRYDFLCWTVVNPNGTVRDLAPADFDMNHVHTGSNFRILERDRAGGWEWEAGSWHQMPPWATEWPTGPPAC